MSHAYKGNCIDFILMDVGKQYVCSRESTFSIFIQKTYFNDFRTYTAEYNSNYQESEWFILETQQIFTKNIVSFKIKLRFVKQKQKFYCFGIKLLQKIVPDLFFLTIYNQKSFVIESKRPRILLLLPLIYLSILMSRFR